MTLARVSSDVIVEILSWLDIESVLQAGASKTLRTTTSLERVWAPRHVRPRPLPSRRRRARGSRDAPESRSAPLPAVPALAPAARHGPGRRVDVAKLLELAPVADDA